MKPTCGACETNFSRTHTRHTHTRYDTRHIVHKQRTCISQRDIIYAKKIYIFTHTHTQSRRELWGMCVHCITIIAIKYIWLQYNSYYIEQKFFLVAGDVHRLSHTHIYTRTVNRVTHRVSHHEYCKYNIFFTIFLYGNSSLDKYVWWIHINLKINYLIYSMYRYIFLLFDVRNFFCFKH